MNTTRQPILLLNAVNGSCQKVQTTRVTKGFCLRNRQSSNSIHIRLLFLLRPFTELMKQTRQAVRAVKQSIFLDVYVSK